MGKRKRGDSAKESNDNVPDSKRPKPTSDRPVRSEKTLKHGKSLNSSKGLRQSPASAKAVVPDDPPPEPPSGLNKAQRKRWRKRQKKLASGEGGDASHLSLSYDVQEPAELPSHTTATPASQSSKPIIDKVKLKRLALTQLMATPYRSWQTDTGNRNVSRVKEDLQAQGIDAEKVTEDGMQADPAMESKRPATAIAESAPDDILVGSVSSASSVSSKARSPANESLPGQKSASKDTVSDADERTGKLQVQATIKPSQADLRSVKRPHMTAAPQNHAFRRVSFGQKARSIPSHFENDDVKGSFQRFSAFLHGSDSESSDDDSEESSSNANDENSGQELATNASAPADIETNQTLLESDAQLHSQAEMTGEKEERQNCEDDDRTDFLPRFSNLASRQPSMTASTWPANVGVKRGVSFVDQELGGPRSDPGPVLEENPKLDYHPYFSDQTRRPGPFDIDDEEDSQALLRTVDEISKGVFGSTRAIPASKPPLSPDPVATSDQGNGGLTSACSDRRVTRSMLSPKSSQTMKDLMSALVAPVARDMVVCNAVRIPEDQTFTTEKTPDAATRTEESSGYISDNIVVATAGGRDIGGDASSSSLSELSHSPSPPPAANGNKPQVRDIEVEADIPGLADTDSDIESVPAEPLVRKKRKMTGRTSKHFTPEKKSKRKRVSLKVESDHTLDPVPKNKERRISEDTRLSEVDRAQDTITVTQQRRRRSTRFSRENRYLDSSGFDAELEDGTATSKIEYIEAQEDLEVPPRTLSTRSATKKKRKTTGKKSTYFTPPKPKPVLDPNIIDRVDFYNTTAGVGSKENKRKRVPAGTSTAPVPSIQSVRFGIIQEKLWQEPFWLLIAVTFLNKTTGRAAVPIFWSLKERYPTPEALAEAAQEDLHDMIYHLGLQTQRSKRLIKIAKAWVQQPPAKGSRFRTLHYPSKGDGKGHKATELVEGDTDECEGALEIGHIPGCGPYAWDSWRIFCRDLLRGVAGDYCGKNARQEGFVPEWQKVLPLDKELRACLRWMWLREGWIWNHETGEKRRATPEEMQRAVLGEMEIDDPQERKFAAQAAGVEVIQDDETDMLDAIDVVSSTRINPLVKEEGIEERQQLGTPEQAVDVSDASDNIVVMPTSRIVRRSTRLST